MNASTNDEDSAGQEDHDENSVDDSDNTRGWDHYEHVDYQELVCASNTESELFDRATGSTVTLECMPDGPCFSDRENYLSELLGNTQRTTTDSLYSPLSKEAIQIPVNSTPMATERSSPWISADIQDKIGTALGKFEGARDFSLGVVDFLNNYSAMREANTIDADKYYHCLANCEATERGPGGEAAALLISYGRELVDIPKYTLQGVPPEKIIQEGIIDLEANRVGREGALSGVRCTDACKPTKPRGL